ncbi:uncharacterized protein LOC143809250 isoform X2 [Ranitomeya variabilis]|uniref:uncharacterized protein LOC143809250 isoform X2 n=1 Tax=Ranitomeya variabilis TaxID=490064 RepID=UPI004056D0FB
MICFQGSPVQREQTLWCHHNPHLSAIHLFTLPRVPQWVKSILEVSAKMKDDKLRRRKAYRMVRRQLWAAGIGLDRVSFPTYVYPGNLKALIRSLFPENICNYPDPDHDKVVKVTMEDLFLVSDEKP